VNSFSAIAHQLHDSGDEEAMQQAAAMGRKLDPNNPLYAGGTGIEEADSATMLNLMRAALDGEHDMAPSGAPDSGSSEPAAGQVEHIDFELIATPPSASPTPDVDFDVTSTIPSLAAPDALDFDVTSTIHSLASPDALDFDIASHEPAKAADGMDFGIASQGSAAEEPQQALPNLDDLFFDVMSPATTEVKAETVAVAEPLAGKSAEESAEDEGMKFTLDFPLDDVKEPTAPPPLTVNLSDINLDLNDVSEPVPVAASSEKSEQWHDVATKLDLARAYQEMGDDVGAREILDEVMLEGDEAQKQDAQLLINQLS
jgi:pilus assembly protein FimV